MTQPDEEDGAVELNLESGKIPLSPLTPNEEDDTLPDMVAEISRTPMETAKMSAVTLPPALPPLGDEVVRPNQVRANPGVGVADSQRVGGRGGATSPGAASVATAATTHTVGGTRKITRHDIKAIFRRSHTTGAVTFDQIMRIKKMHDQLSGGVDMDFNYCCLLMVASVVASLGLALDSATTVISSMLLSPIMGPVLGMSYGLVIWDLPLIKRSIRNELVSIVICVIFGLIIGACCHWTYLAESWPTQEMLSRGTRTTFLCGFPIAFFSGLGVALSVLDDQTSSLVGVAISASLLPPAVNCGMMFIVAAITGEDWGKFTFDTEDGDSNTKLKGWLEDKLSEDVPNFSQVGIMSLLLTIANVIMVALGSALMFRAKETLPVKKKVFWDDLKIARRIYQERIIDPVTGEALLAKDLIAIYNATGGEEQSYADENSVPVSKHSGPVSRHSGPGTERSRGKTPKHSGPVTKATGEVSKHSNETQ